MISGIVRKPIKDLNLKSAYFSVSSLSCSLTVQGKCLVEVITIEQSKWYLLKLVLFKIDCSHLYVYLLLIICLCHVLFLALPTISETEHQKVLISWFGIVILYTPLYRYWVIEGNSGTPFHKVSAIYCNYYYYGLIHITDLYS